MEQSLRIISDIDPTDLADMLKAELPDELADVQFKAERSRSAERFEVGTLIVLLTAAAKLAPLVMAVLSALKGRGKGETMKLRAKDGYEIEIPANTPAERVKELIGAPHSWEQVKIE